MRAAQEYFARQGIACALERFAVTLRRLGQARSAPVVRCVNAHMIQCRRITIGIHAQPNLLRHATEDIHLWNGRDSPALLLKARVSDFVQAGQMSNDLTGSSAARLLGSPRL
jgi:hypothetical protein